MFGDALCWRRITACSLAPVTAMSLRRLRCPDRTVTWRCGIPSVAARNVTTASLAFPSRACSRTRIFKASPWRPASSVRLAPGWTCTTMTASAAAPVAVPAAPCVPCRLGRPWCCRPCRACTSRVARAAWACCCCLESAFLTPMVTEASHDSRSQAPVTYVSHRSLPAVSGTRAWRAHRRWLWTATSR